MSLKPHITRDGSSTLWSERFGQYYHNPNGAEAESREVFFDRGGVCADLQAGRPVRILEVGFGTGLNLLLFSEYVDAVGSQGHSYATFEKFPLDEETARTLNYPGTGRLVELFAGLKPGWNRPEWDSRIDLHIWVGDFADGMAHWSEADLPPATHVLHDPFSPAASPELWSEEAFAELRRVSAPDALLSTYGAASAPRRAMAAAGWQVARAPGALGKREMTLASPDAERIRLPFTRPW